MRYILENPIYAGWRVYDEERDPSAEGCLKRKKGGRQSDRRKIKRPGNEIIPVHVLEGLVSQEDFGRVQQMIDLKRQKHWRVRNEPIVRLHEGPGAKLPQFPSTDERSSESE